MPLSLKPKCVICRNPIEGHPTLAPNNMLGFMHALCDPNAVKRETAHPDSALVDKIVANMEMDTSMFGEERARSYVRRVLGALRRIAKEQEMAKAKKNPSGLVFDIPPAEPIKDKPGFYRVHARGYDPDVNVVATTRPVTIEEATRLMHAWRMEDAACGGLHDLWVVPT